MSLIEFSLNDVFIKFAHIEIPLFKVLYSKLVIIYYWIFLHKYKYSEENVSLFLMLILNL